MAKKGPRLGICTYCGESGKRTDDHIPPKNLFPDPKPSDLITVPCCEACNRDASLDDEYFRLVTVFRHDVAGHPAARARWPSVFRSLDKPQKLRFRTAFLRTLRPVRLRSRAGLHLGESGVFQTDVRRVSNVIDRITRGLYYHEFRKRLPRTTEVLVLSDVDLNDPEQLSMVQGFSGLPAKSVGEGVFSYRYIAPEEDSATTAWLFIFYENYAVISITLGSNLAATGPTTLTRLAVRLQIGNHFSGR